MTDVAGELERRVLAAQDLLARGQADAAQRLLVDATGLAEEAGAHPLSVLLHLVLGQCAVRGDRLDDARVHYQRAFGLAVELRDPELGSAAVGGLGIVELNGDNLAAAGQAFHDAADLARMAGPGPALGAALHSHAEVLHRLGDDAAASSYVEALAQPDLGDALRGTVLDDLARELARQRRPAVDLLHVVETALTALAEAGAHQDAYRTLLAVTRLTRTVDPAASAAAFTRAHDLIHALHSTVDTEHYGKRYLERVRQIEAETSGRFDGLHLGVTDLAARQDLAEGMQLLREHRYGEAETKLRSAEGAWSSIGARHDALGAQVELGRLALYRGDYEQAWALLEPAGADAAALGDAGTEIRALAYLCSVAMQLDQGGADPLELLARARALVPIVGDTMPDVSGVLNKLAHEVCSRHGAQELAESYLRRSVSDAESTSDAGRRDLAQRLSVQAVRAVQRGDAAESAELEERLTAIRAASTDPMTSFVTSRALGIMGLYTGRMTEETLARLRDSCAAHEEMRQRKGVTDASSGFAEAGQPPYVAAAELALQLGHVTDAFSLLERMKSRTLLDALRATPPAAVAEEPALAREAELWRELVALYRIPDDAAPHERARAVHDADERVGVLRAELQALWDELDGTHPHVRAHRIAEPISAAELPALLAARGDAVLIEFFVGVNAVYAFVAAGAELVPRRITDRGRMAELARLLESDVDVAKLLAHPVYREMIAVVDEAAGDRPAYVVPHDQLHRAPLHLRLDGAGRPVPRPAVHLLPSASLLRTAARPAWRPVAGAAVVGADPLDADPVYGLRFAKAEGEHAGATLGVRAAYGAEVTADWLAGELARHRSPFVHLACHAEFNTARPEDSGLLLAGPDGRRDRVGPDRLAAMDWSGSVVVLGACRSGSHRVEAGDELAGVGRALLAAGAAAIVVSWRQVFDLSSALLLTWLHDELAAAAGPVRIGAVLAAAQDRMRHLSARDVVAWAVGHQAGPHRTVLAAYAIAAAHRTAGDLDRSITWGEHGDELRSGAPGPGTQVWQAEPAHATTPGYAARPFAGPEHWAWFSALGG